MKKTITYVKSPSEQEAPEVILDFLKEWLPPLIKSNVSVMAVEVNKAFSTTIRDALKQSNGGSVDMS